MFQRSLFNFFRLVSFEDYWFQRSRAEAMLERVKQQPQKTTGDILDNAVSWRIPVYPLSKVCIAQMYFTNNHTTMYRLIFLVITSLLICSIFSPSLLPGWKDSAAGPTRLSEIRILAWTSKFLPVPTWRSRRAFVPNSNSSTLGPLWGYCTAQRLRQQHPLLLRTKKNWKTRAIIVLPRRIWTAMNHLKGSYLPTLLSWCTSNLFVSCRLRAFWDIHPT